MARLFNDAAGDTLNAAQAPVTASPFTIAAWVRSNDATVDQAIIEVSDAATGKERFALSLNGFDVGDFVKFTARSDIADVKGSAMTTTGFTVNTWHHVCAVTASATSRSVFIDGGSKGTNTESVTPLNLDRLIAGDSSMSGDIAHIAFWDVALGDDEVASLAAGLSPLRVRPGSLKRYYPLNGQSTEPDVVGQATGLTVTGTTVSEEPPIYNAIVAP